MGHRKLKNEQNETMKAGCIVVSQDKKILLVSNKEGKIWAFPKGHVEQGESLEQSAIRETSEETGHEVKVIKRLSDVTYMHEKTGEHIRIAMFLAEPISSGVGREMAIQSKWFSLEEARETLYQNLVFLLDELE